MTDRPNEGCGPCGEAASKLKMDAEKIKQVIGKVRKGVFDAIAAVLPKEFCQHAGTMKKECLMALRSLLDDEIKRTDENMAEAQKAHERHEKKQG